MIVASYTTKDTKMAKTTFILSLGLLFISQEFPGNSACFPPAPAGVGPSGRYMFDRRDLKSKIFTPEVIKHLGNAIDALERTSYQQSYDLNPKGRVTQRFFRSLNTKRNSRF